MSGLDKTQFPQTMLIGLGSPSASADYPAPKLHRKMNLESIRFYNGGLIAADVLVNAVITVKSGATTLATFTSAVTGFAAAAWINSGVAAQVLAAGAQLKIEVVLTGDPEADPTPIDAPALTNAAVEFIWSPV